MPIFSLRILQTIIVCKNIVKIEGKLYGLNSFFQKCFKLSILDIYKCPFLKILKRLWQKRTFITIIDFYRKSLNYLFKNLLRYFFWTFFWTFFGFPCLEMKKMPKMPNILQYDIK